MTQNTEELMEQLLAQCGTPADLERLQQTMLQRMVNRALDAEMEARLSYRKGELDALREWKTKSSHCTPRA